MFFGVPLNMERFFVLDKTIVLNVAQSYKGLTKTNYVFYNDGTFGILNDFFEVSHLENLEVGTKVASSDKYYIFYKTETDDKVIKNIDGQTVATFKQEGVPIFASKNLYVVDSKNGIVSQYTVTGKYKWSYDLSSYITAISVGDKHVMVGLLNGNIVFIDANTGEFESEYKPSGSSVDVVYGVALSNSSEYAGVISGLNPQRFVLLKRGKNNYMPIYKTEIKNELRRTMYVNFSKDEKFVTYEEPDNFHTYSIENDTNLVVPYKGILKQGIGDILPRYHAIVSKDADKVYVKIFSYKNNYIIFDEVFDAKEIFVSSFRDGFILALDQTISRINLVKSLENAKSIEKKSIKEAKKQAKLDKQKKNKEDKANKKAKKNKENKENKEE